MVLLFTYFSLGIASGFGARSLPQKKTSAKAVIIYWAFEGILTGMQDGIANSKR